MTEAEVPARRSARKPSAAATSARRGSGTETSSRTTINAGIGGVGGGTGIVAIAQQVGVHTVTGQILVYVAPAVSVIAGTVFYQLKLRADWYIERSQVKKARKTIEKQLKNPHTSEDYKIEARETLDELDRAEAAAELARIKFLKKI
jgi:hypothetical protein